MKVLFTLAIVGLFVISIILGPQEKEEKETVTADVEVEEF